VTTPEGSAARICADGLLDRYRCESFVTRAGTGRGGHSGGAALFPGGLAQITSGVSAVDGLASPSCANGEYAFEDDVLVLIFNSRVRFSFSHPSIPG